MLYGFPGTGKSLAAKVIAREWNLPLFRLDISGLLTKWIGESERNMTNFLRSVEAEGPCVLLLDECEKLFSGDMEGTTKRMLAQLLWWLEEHRARVLTVGTSNHLESMPPEFYRPGRFDTTIFINKLTTHEAKEFAAHFYKAIMKVQPPAEHWKKIHTMFSPFDKDYQLSAADVTSLVLSAIKQNKWV
jgi:SpoVK/Ycf46/Vps4 family AAA+-type ATPase